MNANHSPLIIRSVDVHTLVELLMTAGYAAHLGLPLNWREEPTRLLPAAVKAFIFHQAAPQKEPAPTADHLKLVIAYLNHYIQAPCWDRPFGEPTPFVEELKVLRGQALVLKTEADVAGWIDMALEIALDPF